MYVLDVADGWTRALDLFESVHIAEMERHLRRFMILLIDFDDKPNRLEKAKSVIPNHLVDRVFVLGSWTDPEGLKADAGSYKTIGKALADDCRNGTDRAWAHPLLRHNASELERLR